MSYLNLESLKQNILKITSLISILKYASLNFSPCWFFPSLSFFLKLFLKLLLVFSKCAHKSCGSCSFLTNKINIAIEYLQFCSQYCLYYKPHPQRLQRKLSSINKHYLDTSGILKQHTEVSKCEREIFHSHDVQLLGEAHVRQEWHCLCYCEVGEEVWVWNKSVILSLPPPIFSP